MKNNIKNLLLLLVGIVGTRLFLMFYFPLTDTTEARYANTALIMAKTKDWITPFFDYNVPFWGKPVLSFWFQALSYDFFGIYDFAPRVPSLIITLATAWLMYMLLVRIANRITALWSVVIYMSLLLSFGLSGAVLTDPYLAFGTTLSLVSFFLLIQKKESLWSYLFFVGLSIGLLAKGPLAGVIIAGVVIVWISFSFKQRVSTLAKLPWGKGILLTIIISVPWYIIAELKTPGFLNYFIIGEHFGRFLDTGWHGDKYGYVHKNPFGTIWGLWITASFPWGLSAFIIGFKYLLKKHNRSSFLQMFQKDTYSFLIIWMLFIMLFFTFAGNVIWTYVLPSLPPLAILLALFINKNSGEWANRYPKFLLANLLLVPVLSIVGVVVVMVRPNLVATEKYLIAKYHNLAKANEPIYFLENRSFSSIYYMNQPITITSMKEFNELNTTTIPHYFAVAGKDDIPRVDKKNLHSVYESKKYILYESN